MDNTVRKLNIGNTDYNFPQGFPIIAGYSSYGSRKIDLTQSFSLPFSTQYFGFSDTFPRYTSRITAAEAITEIKKYRPLIFRWDWYDTESSGSEHIVTAELYPLDGNLYQFGAEVPITVYRLLETTTYISRIDISLLSNTFSYTYITTISNKLNDVSDVNITTPANGEVLTYNSTAQEWVNSPNVSAVRQENDHIEFDATSAVPSRYFGCKLGELDANNNTFTGLNITKLDASFACTAYIEVSKGGYTYEVQPIACNASLTGPGGASQVRGDPVVAIERFIDDAGANYNRLTLIIFLPKSASDYYRLEIVATTSSPLLTATVTTVTSLYT